MSISLKRLINTISHNLGEIITNALSDPKVIEIMVNPDGNIWIEKLGEEMKLSGQLAPEQSLSVISNMAGFLNTTVTVQNPIVEGELPLDGSRFEGLIPPVVTAPSFTIRKKASQVFSLNDYVTANIMPEELLKVFENAILKKQNILVVGGTGSGKTTFVNALILALSEMVPSDRLVILEDTLELQSKSKNTVFFRSSDFVNMQRLLKATMRYRPDRILIGEVRDKTALDLLKAWNTGHPGGIATVHANSALEGLSRLEELTAEANVGEKQRLIGGAVDLIVFIERSNLGRKITEVLKVNTYQKQTENYLTEVLYSAIEPYLDSKPKILKII